MRAILTYHSIDVTGSPISISPSDFRRHLDWLAGGDVRTLPLDELVTATDDRDAVSLTFDDALANFADHGWPALAERGLPATMFVPCDHVGGSNDWQAAPGPGVPSLPLLDWEDLGRLAEEGLVLGSHGRRHLDSRHLAEPELEEELAGSAEILRRKTGTRPSSFAYPYGYVDARAASITARHYALACTTDLRLLAPSDTNHLLPRLDAYYLRRPGTLEAWGSHRFARRLKLRRWARAARARVTSLGSGRG